MNDLDEAYLGLRGQVFSCKPEDIGFAAKQDGWSVYAVLMETGYDDSVVSFVSLLDGTTSLYFFSNGGGMIGAGEHENVRIFSELLLGKANREYKRFNATKNTDLPSVGMTKIYLFTSHGPLMIEAKEDDLGEGQHDQSELFHYCHNVIFQMQNTPDHGEAAND